MTLYERLNVASDATGETIKASYRKLAAKHHPDKPDGSTETMQELQLAYSVLSDPEKRDRYDRTGEENAPSQQDPVEAILSGLFMRLIAQAIESDFNILAEARKALRTEIDEANRQKGIASAHSDRLNTLLGRVTCKDELNYFEMAATAQLAKAENIVERAEGVITNTNAALESLEAYGDSFIERSARNSTNPFNVPGAGNAFTGFNAR